MAGGISGPLFFGPLISTGSRGLVAPAFTIGAALMIAGGVTKLILGIRAECAPLDDIAKPLTAEEAEALAAKDEAETERPRPDLHQSWARVHRSRAWIYRLSAQGDGEGALQAEIQARAEEAARALAFHIEADQRRKAAETEVEHQRQELKEQEERIRRRLEASRQRARGLGRFRPGPGRLTGSPRSGSRVPPPEEALDNEITTIERAL
ncbi:MAG: hypothetical protein ACREOL_02360 [Candidatus Dormibacteria bacterium]